MNSANSEKYGIVKTSHELADRTGQDILRRGGAMRWTPGGITGRLTATIPMLPRRVPRCLNPGKLRETRAATGLEWLECREAWKGLKTIGRYRTFRKAKEKGLVNELFPKLG
jgi:hypothetical protein